MAKAVVKPGKARSAVVTGAGRGIGRATAIELLGRGYQVVVTDLDEDAANSATTDSERHKTGETPSQAARCPGDHGERERAGDAERGRDHLPVPHPRRDDGAAGPEQERQRVLDQ